MFAYDEQNIDAYHSKTDRIYRLVTEVQEEDGLHRYLSTPGPFAESLKEEFPFIEETAHVTYFGSQVLASGEKRFADREWAVATPEIFKILDFDIVSGDPMSDKNVVGMVINEDLALRLFETTDAVGKIIEETNFGAVEVIAVMKEMPRNASYRFNNIYVVNTYEEFGESWQRFINSWSRRFAQTWVLFKEGSGPEDMAGLKLDYLNKYSSEEEREVQDFYFQNVADIHLGSEGIEAGGMNPRVSIPYSDNEFISMTLMMGFW